MNIVLFIFYYCFVQTIESEEEKSALSKNLLPYFRRKIKETIEDTTVKVSQNDLHNKMLSFLIENIKEVFDKSYEVDQIIVITTSFINTTAVIPKISTSSAIEISTDEVIIPNNINVTKAELVTIATNFKQNSNITEQYVTITANFNTTSLVPNIMPFIYKLTYDTCSTFPPSFVSVYENLGSSTEEPIKSRIQEELRSLLKDGTNLKANRKERERGLETIDKNKITNAPGTDNSSDMKRSCIICNNVDDEKCNDPQNKLISASVCPKVEDICYSLHTPFGIVDRGCFNEKHNLTIYVCSCNLCNHISISEMPYIFSNKRDWIDNVIELSRTRHLKKSVYKDMSCLSCMVNTFSKSTDMLDNANCLEGNIASLPTVQCTDNEICAVKAIRSDGYVWRGCVKSPLYNYWLTLCDSDLCNYDMITSLYDTD